MLKAGERFTVRFKRAVLERIERDHEERASRSRGVLNEERDALIRSMASEGHPIAEIILATAAKGSRVRAVLGLPEIRPRQRERG